MTMKLEELCLLFGVRDDDFARVRALGALVTPKMDEFVEQLYAYFKDVLGPDYEMHFPDASTTARAQTAARRAPRGSRSR